MKALRYLNKYFWKYRGRLFMGFVFIALTNLGNVYPPQLVKEGITFLEEVFSQSDSIGNGTTRNIELPGSLGILYSFFGNGKTSIDVDPGNFSTRVVIIGILLGLLYLVVYLIKGLFLFYQRQTIIVMSRYIEYDLKNEIYDQYQKLDTAFYKRNRTGDLMNRISEDVNRVRMYLGPAVMYTINLVVLAVFCIIFMLRENVELTLYTLAPLPFMMAVIFYVSTLINRKTDNVQKQQSVLSSAVQEAMSGIRVLKSFTREKSTFEEFDSQCEEYKKRQLSLVRVESLFLPVIVLLVGLSTILTIYIGGKKVIAGEMELGVIFQFVFYVNLLTWPFASVGWVTSMVQKAEASQARINEFLLTSPSVKNNASGETKVAGDIRFNNVSHVYPDSGIEALSNVTFHVPRGQTLAIIGRTGSGKSTIAALLLRLYDPSKGNITIDGIELELLNLHHLRDSIGYVPQDVFLFSDTVKNNIGFGADNVLQDEITKAAKISDVHENIAAFPQGYDTMLGERGINLSGGQKQRVSIARALVKNPEILLFDDCLSAVDTQTEENILAALKDVMRGKTAIIISHRISSIKHADNIIVLDKGRVVEAGNHENLIRQNGLYTSLYRKQLLEEQLA